MTNSDDSFSEEESQNVLEQSILIRVEEKMYDQEPFDVAASFN